MDSQGSVSYSGAPPDRLLACAAAAVMAAALPALTVAQDASVQMPQAMWDEPYHQLVFARDQIRIMDVFFPGGATSEFHFHEYPVTYVIIQPGRVSDQTYGKAWINVPENALSGGQLLVRTDYLSDNLHHRVRNIDTIPTQIFAVANLDAKAASPSKADSESVDGVTDNPWFRVHELSVGAQALSDPISVEYDAVLMQSDNGASHVVSGGERQAFKSQGGAFSYHPAGSTLSIANEAAAIRTFVLIEVKD